MMRLACAKALGQEGAGEGQRTGEQRMGKRRVLSEAGGWALEVSGRTSVFSKSKKKPLTCFKERSDILRFSLLGDCSDCGIENALGEGEMGEERPSP